MNLAKQAVTRAKTSATIIIRKNLKTYPEFDWVVVEKYQLDKNGKAK